MNSHTARVPTFLNGLPLHPLVVHAVIVLVPLTVLGAILVAVVPAARRRYGSLVALVGAAGLASDIVAQNAGEALEHLLPGDPAIAAHAALGDGLKYWVGGLFVVTVAFVLLHRFGAGQVRREGPGATTAPAVTGPNRIVATVLAVLVVAVALGTGYQVYRVGESGAQAVWGGRVYQQQ